MSSSPEAGGGGTSDGSTSGDSAIKTVPVPDSSTDASTDGTSSDASPSDGSPIIEPEAGPCDTSEQADNTQLFVSNKTGSTASGNCTSQVPCTTISAALSAAATSSNRSVVYVDEGSYTDQVIIPKGITAIRGGWIYGGGTWAIDCSQARLMATTITAPNTANKTVVAADLAGTTTLEALSIRTKSAGNTGESLYGVFATGSTTTLLLVDTTVAAMSAGAGAAGVVGGDGSTGASSCSAGANPPATATAATPPASGGANANYSVAGAVTSAGPTGTVGGSGGNGVPGPAGQCADSVSCDGSKGDCNTDQGGQVCAPMAAPGCGGGPAGVGGGGGGGGSSIALFAWDAHVTVTGGALQGGSGGAGGPGAAGGTGGEGSVSMATSAFATTACSANCLGLKTKLTGDPGVAGAPGANGPPGAGGAGGDSYAYYENAGNITILTQGLGYDTTNAPGGAGAGTGPGKAPDGHAGQGGTHN